MSEISETPDIQTILAAAVEHGGLLRVVEVLVDDELAAGPVAIRFELEGATLCIWVESLDDTVRVAESWPAELAPLAPVPMEPSAIPWNALIGANLRGAWVLTNEQGYADGLQLEFQDRSREPREPTSSIQLVAVASTLELRTTTRIELPRLGRHAPRESRS